MNVPRFRIEPEQAHQGSFLLSPRESHHAIKVLRLKSGDAVGLFDGRGGVWAGVVVAAEDGLLRVMAGRNEARPTAQVRTELAVAVIRPERMDWLIQKSCELGVAAIHPLLTERTIVRVPREKAVERRRRWQRVAEESCKQCGLSELPSVSMPRPFEDFVASADGYDMIFLPTLACRGIGLRRALQEHAKAPSRVLAMIGPEGDFTPEEADRALSCGATAVGLGPLVMRSETAAVYMASAIKFFYEGEYP